MHIVFSFLMLHVTVGNCSWGVCTSQWRTLFMWQLFRMDGDSGDFFLSQWPLQELWRWWRLFQEALSISSCDLTWSHQCTLGNVQPCAGAKDIDMSQILTLGPPEATRFWGKTDMQADYFSPVWWVLWWRGHRHVIYLCYKRCEGHVRVHLVSCVLYHKIQKPKCGVCTREGDDFLYEGVF